MSIATDRVRRHTPARTNQRIDEETRTRLRGIGDSTVAIDHRLGELEREWDVERALFAVTSVNLLLGLATAARDRRWLAWPLAVAGFQLQHALEGWCPPVAVLRRAGVRTRQEIEAERAALKALRGDFAQPVDRIAGLDPDLALASASR